MKTGRDWSNAAINQEVPGLPEAGQGKEEDSPRLWRGYGLASTLISGGQPSELCSNAFLLL